MIMMVWVTREWNGITGVLASEIVWIPLMNTLSSLNCTYIDQYAGEEVNADILMVVSKVNRQLSGTYTG